jgi:hypothetical protein
VLLIILLSRVMLVQSLVDQPVIIEFLVPFGLLVNQSLDIELEEILQHSTSKR